MSLLKSHISCQVVSLQERHYSCGSQDRPSVRDCGIATDFYATLSKLTGSVLKRGSFFMAISVNVDLSVDDTFKIAGQAARALNYSVLFVGDNELSVKKGSVLGNLVVGAVVPVCDFRVSVRPALDKSVEVAIQVNRPWWSGMLGLKRVRAKADELADAIASAVRERGGKVLKRTPADH
jgi:hypothetical protein